MSEIKIVRTTTPKEKPQDETKLGFGAVTTDHMFIMNYTCLLYTSLPAPSQTQQG